MRTQRTQTSQTVRKGARLLATEMIREPVKEAVREALAEETRDVRRADATDPRSGRRDWENESGSSDRQRSRGRSVVSKLGMAVVGMVAVLGLRTYLRRKRSKPDEYSRFGVGSSSDTGETDEYGKSEDRVGTVDRSEPGASSSSSD